MYTVKDIIEECVQKGGYTINDIISVIIEYGHTKEDALKGIDDFVKQNASPPDMLF